MTSSDDVDIAAAANKGVTQPATARGTINTLYPIANTKLDRMTERARRAAWIVTAIGDRFAPRNTISATVWLISAAEAGDAETYAAAKDGLSFNPSPTIRTR